MNLQSAFLLAVGVSAAPSADAREIPAPLVAWQPHDIAFEAAEMHPWWEFPIRTVFTHSAGGGQLTIEGFWDGGHRWIVRFAAPRPGRWTYRTTSADRGLDGHTGELTVTQPSAAQVAGNANLRGMLRIAPAGRHFEFADGTPFLLLADTVWAMNTRRCGLGTNEDGPFFEYLADRKAKGFTAILMQYFHGYGDYPEAPGHRNEGGQAFLERDASRLNPEHFRALDQRMRGLWERGLVAAINTTWWAKTRECLFRPADACRISAYCAIRYGAFNALWSVSGEYQYAFKDCGWTADDITRIGEALQAHNPWHHPVSVHPSARLDWPAPHNVQSSRPFHGERWLDHHWLQTGQSRDRLFNIVTRLRDDRALQPPAPVFLSEAFYESAGDADAAYHVRWQVWTAFLNGAAGYGYGADGIWQFYDPRDPNGEKGKDVKGVGPWRDALRFPGSNELAQARKLLGQIEWWKLMPQRDRVRRNGAENTLPTRSDLSPPEFAASPEGRAVMYLPRGNEMSAVTIQPTSGPATARWYNPRRGQFHGESMTVAASGWWTLPARPEPAEDWIVVIEPDPPKKTRN